MEKLYELYDMLCDELEKVTEKGELSAGSLEVAEKLTETMKNLKKIMEMEGYSGEYHDMGSYNRGSYAQRRDSRGRYSRGYSRHTFEESLEDAMRNAPDERSRKDIERLLNKM